MLNQKKFLKILAVVLAFFLFLTVILSFHFIATHLKHACTGEDCPICYELQIAEAIIKQVSLGVIGILLFAYLIIHFYFCTHIFLSSTSKRNPIKDKIRMND